MTTFNIYQFFDGFDISGKTYTAIMAIESFVERVQDTIGKWVRRNEGRKQLAKMSDHMLRDIGLTRFEANREVGKHFWQE